VKAEVVSNLQASMIAGQFRRLTKEEAKRLEPKPGMTVKCMSGPFDGFMCKIDKILPEDRIKVLFNLFDREFPSMLDLDQIELVG
jgi:transcription antitermination factor NusG